MNKTLTLNNKNIKNMHTLIKLSFCVNGVNDKDLIRFTYICLCNKVSLMFTKTTYEFFMKYDKVNFYSIIEYTFKEELKLHLYKKLKNSSLVLKIIKNIINRNKLLLFIKEIENVLKNNLMEKNYTFIINKDYEIELFYLL